jgi:hypothetical protein
MQHTRPPNPHSRGLIQAPTLASVTGANPSKLIR